MKLLIAEFQSGSKVILQGKIETYKYRDDIVLLSVLEEKRLSHIIASAYCVLYTAFFNNSARVLLTTQQTGVPVIANDNLETKAFATDTALYANFDNIDMLAQLMQLIYKDEQLRSQLIKKGIKNAKRFDWDTTAKTVWKVIENNLQ